VTVERLIEIIDEPEDGDAGLRLAEMITLGGMVHLVDSEIAGIEEGLEKVEIVCPAGIDHRHGWKHNGLLFIFKNKFKFNLAPYRGINN